MQCVPFLFLQKKKLFQEVDVFRAGGPHSAATLRSKSEEIAGLSLNDGLKLHALSDGLVSFGKQGVCRREGSNLGSDIFKGDVTSSVLFCKRCVFKRGGKKGLRKVAEHCVFSFHPLWCVFSFQPLWLDIMKQERTQSIL